MCRHRYVTAVHWRASSTAEKQETMHSEVHVKIGKAWRKCRSTRTKYESTSAFWMRFFLVVISCAYGWCGHAVFAAIERQGSSNKSVVEETVSCPAMFVLIWLKGEIVMSSSWRKSPSHETESAAKPHDSYEPNINNSALLPRRITKAKVGTSRWCRKCGGFFVCTSRSFVLEKTQKVTNQWK